VELKTRSRTVNLAVGGILLCVGNDTNWIEQLRPKIRLDTDENGLLVGAIGSGFKGKTKDPGIWFVPFEAGSDQFKSEAADAHTAVNSLTAILDENKIEHPVLVSEVDVNQCGGCGTCVKTCAFSASSIDTKEKISIIDLKRCVGCGNCVTSCPTGARDLIAYPTRYVISAIDILSKGAVDGGEPKVLAFLCKNSGYPATDAAGDPVNHLPAGNYSPNVLPLRVECAGNIDTVYIMNAFKKGFDGVALVVCKDGHCHNVVGNTDMERRLGLLRAVMRSRHIDDNRMRIFHMGRREGKRLNEELKAFSEELKEINRQ
jgi:coenzyme F420-reducing hydrogenase delta subunit/NAD-dependent dihydropyrimidine dehydrogenase PreA subunit